MIKPHRFSSPFICSKLKLAGRLECNRGVSGLQPRSGTYARISNVPRVGPHNAVTVALRLNRWTEAGIDWGEAVLRPRENGDARMGVVHTLQLYLAAGILQPGVKKLSCSVGGEEHFAGARGSFQSVSLACSHWWRRSLRTLARARGALSPIGDGKGPGAVLFGELCLSCMQPLL